MFVCASVRLNLRCRYTRASGGERVNVFGREVHVCEVRACMSLCTAAHTCICVRGSVCVCACVRKGGNRVGEAVEGAHRRRLWILHSMRIKATASPKVINLAAVLTTTLLLFFHISLTLTVSYLHNSSRQSIRLCCTDSQKSTIYMVSNK